MTNRSKQYSCGHSLQVVLGNSKGLSLLGTVVVATTLLLAVMTFRYTEALGSKSVYAVEAREIARLTMNTASISMASLDEDDFYNILKDLKDNHSIDLGEDLTSTSSADLAWLSNFETNPKIEQVIIQVKLMDAFGNIITDLPYSFEEMGQYSKLISTRVNFKDQNGSFSMKSDFLVLRQL